MLSNKLKTENSTHSEISLSHENLKSQKRSLQLLREIFSIALPALIAYLSHIMVEVINLAFVGHLG